VRDMKIGYLLDTHGGPYDQPAPTREQVSAFSDHLLQEADLAEAGGFHSIVVPERHGRTECMFPPPLILLAAIAPRTQYARLGTYICLPPLHNPMHLAEQFAMLDHLSKGRVIFGAASGYHTGYHEFAGVPFKERGARFEESYEVILKAWTQDKFSHEGKFWQFHDVRLTPKPYQQPRPEIWIGGMFPKTIARAGRMGDAWCSDPFPLDPKVWNQQVQIYRDEAKQHGNKSTVVLMRDGWVSPRREESDEIFLDLAIQEWLFYFRWGILTHHPEFQKESDFTRDRARKHFITGTPEDCIRQAQAFGRDFDTDYLIMRFRLPGGPDRSKVLECLKMWGREVMPAFPR
jgi:alkanesulfonate monooxygenase SsuD/methylene tetrahydromethanopterin reductase-like flavin-dependent oxidoreductase (luciferase family)